MQSFIVLLKQLDCVLGALPASSTMANAKNSLRLNKLIKGGIFVAATLVQDVGEAQKKC